MTREYPPRPIVGIGVAVLRPGAVLLARRGRPPNDGAWSLPGGAQELGETAEAAARRELAEETGLVASALRPAGVACGVWDGRPDRVHFFSLHLDQLPALQLDNREIIATRLVLPDDLSGLALTGPVAAYLGRPAVLA